MDIIVYIILIVLFLKLPTEKDRRTKEALERCEQNIIKGEKVLREREERLRGNKND